MDPNFSDQLRASAELRRAYEATERAEKLLAEAGKLSVSGVYVRDTLAGGYWSADVFQIFGLDRAEQAPPSDVWVSMVLLPDAARTAEATQRAFREKQDFEAEYRVRLRGGSVKALRSRAHPVSARFGYDFALMGVVTDITAEIEARSAVAEAVEELHRRFPSVDGLSTNLRERILDPAQSAWRAARGGLSHSHIRHILKLIEERLPEKISVKEMAREAGLSESHFSRAFKHITGETPHQFALRVRLERASAALSRPSVTNIAAVAAECGFFDQSHFTREFRKKFGMTPGAAARGVALNRKPGER